MLRVRGLIVISSGDAVHDFVRVEAALADHLPFAALALAVTSGHSV